MNKFLRFLRLNLPLLTVIVVALFVCAVNFEPQATLSGWDTLQPELNLGQYFQRVFFGAWQPHQGLGAPASQAHLAELVRLPILWLLQIFPNNWIRFFFFFICYIAGGVGVYYFLTRCWLRQTKFTTWPAAAAAIFYLLNLITLQHFYVPLEMFAVHFGTLPWIFLTVQHAVERERLKDYLWFFVAMALAAPAAHTATLFYLYIIFVGIYALFLLLAKNGTWKKKIKTAAILGGLIFMANAYWLIPNLYYTVWHSDYVSEAKISQNFSPEAFWNNQAYGWLPQVLTGKNFLFNWNDYDYDQQKFVPLFDEWNQYYETTHLFFLQYILVAVALVGIYQAFKKQSWPAFSMLAIFCGSLFFLINLNFPTGFLYNLVRLIPIIKEGIRFPFTKFSIVYLFALVVFFANGLVFIQELFTKRWEMKRTITTTVGVGAIIIILLANGPALVGNLISERMRVEFPTQYQDLYNFLQLEDRNQVLVKLPLLGYSGWTYNAWGEDNGYQGAGWLWFGVPQALLDREFDRWAESNEEVYRQLNLAINQDNDSLFNSVRQQYNLSLFLIDESAFSLDAQTQNYADLKQFLIDNGGELIWQKDFLSLYKFQPAASLFTSPTAYTLINQDDIGSASVDVIYEQTGNYLLSDLGATYPFAFLMTEESNQKIDWLDYQVVIKGEKITRENQVLTIPGFEKNETYVTQVQLTYLGDQLKLEYPEYWLQNGEQKILLPKLKNMSVDVGPVNAERLLLDFNGTIIFLAQGETATTFFNFALDETQSLKLIDDRNVLAKEENNKISYSAESKDVYVQPFPTDYFDEIKTAKTETLINSGQNLELLLDRKWELDANLITELNVRNCAQFGKVEDLSNAETGILKLQATERGNACVAITPPGFKNNSDYLVRFKGQNLAGRSWKVILIQNNNGQRLLEVLLPEGDFDNTYNVITQENDTYEQLFFSLETNSFGQKSANTLNDIYILPFNAQRLSRIRISQRNTAKIISNGAVESYQKNNSSRYQVRFQAKGVNNLLVFNQTYDALWRAKIVNTITGKKQILKPSEFNGWANAWEIPTGEWDITIYYLPQIWAYWAMVGFVGTLAGLIWGAYRQKKNHRPFSLDLKKIFE
ncbi:MAG: hypothetical protein Q4G02_03250 [bacterium]|nr:hypothetical protein [bacterium]